MFHSFFIHFVICHSFVHSFIGHPFTHDSFILPFIQSFMHALLSSVQCSLCITALQQALRGSALYSFIVRILCRGEKITYRCDCRELLDEMSVELTSSWKEVKKLIKEDVRYSKFSSSDRVRSRHATVSAISRCHASFLQATLTGVYSFTLHTNHLIGRLFFPRLWISVQLGTSFSRRMSLVYFRSIPEMVVLCRHWMENDLVKCSICTLKPHKQQSFVSILYSVSLSVLSLSLSPSSYPVSFLASVIFIES